MCDHRHAIPVEYVAGRRVYPPSGEMMLDWYCNIINANFLRVTKLYCPVCCAYITLGEDKNETNNPKP